MEKFSVKEKYETEIRNIWGNEMFKEFEFLNRGFAVQDEISKNAIMFVGINPSFDENSKEVHQEFYNVEQDGKSHPYFNKFKEISKKANHNWTHFDFLYFRETNQKYINELLKKENGIEFIFKQLEISKKVILEAKPKILIVSKHNGKTFYGFRKNQNQTQGVWMGFDFIFDENLGTHKIINNPELENTPVFFTSMLTGQRALDNGSFERLNWHINFVLNQLN